MSSSKVVCVSPHLDDVVLSVGATMHGLAAAGVDVAAVTVFAGDPTDERRSSYWDAQRGDATHAEAARNRRAEDAAGCAEVGARPVWGDFADITYVRRRDPADIVAWLTPHLEGADAVLIPGWPLANADHRYVATLMVEHFDRAPLVLYSELPYAAVPVMWAKGVVRHRVGPFTRHLVGGGVTWHKTRPTPEDEAAKRRGCAAYAGEIVSLGWKQQVGRTLERVSSGEYLGVPDGRTLPEVLRGVLRAAR